MGSTGEIVFFLDNTEVSIIEVEQTGSGGLRHMLWFIYNKAGQTINRFNFRPLPAKRTNKKIKSGLLKLTVKPGRYVIEIDTRMFNFNELHPLMVPVNAKTSIEKYLNTVV